ncbi:MAG TPA: insulinase family protein [Kofleriaceae bacterium]|nr:insulinase family protein [Kofleriaceae bacterium]
MSAFRVSVPLLASVSVVAALGLALAPAGCGTPAPRFGSLSVAQRNLRIDNPMQLLELSNGMIVALRPDDRTNLVTVDVRYRAGASLDPPGKGGLAHLVEHLTFELPAGSDGATLWDRFSTLALDQNAYTVHDYVHYTSTALAEHLDDLLDLEAARLAGPCERLDPAIVARERDVVLAEADERHTATTDVLEQVNVELWGAHHPYARPAGSREVRAATKADVCAFYDANYLPQGAFLVVTGHFDPAVVGKEIGHRFGPITRTSPGGLVPGIAPPILRGDTTLHTADIAHPAAVLYFAAPPWGDPGEATHEMLLHALAGELDDLDREHDWVIDTDVGYVGDGRQRATQVVVTVSDRDHLDAAVDAVLERGRALFLDAKHDPKALRRVGALRGLMQTRTVERLDSVMDRGAWIADYLTYTTDNMFAVGTLQADDAVTADELSQHARELFDRARMHVVHIVPSGKGTAAPAVLGSAERTYDLKPWRLEVDPAEATHALALPPGGDRLDLDDFRLKNGLRVLIYVDPSSPVLDARMVYPVGSIDEPAGEPGVATLAADLLDHDYDRSYGTDVDRINWAFGLGTQLSTEVDDDSTVFSAAGLAVFGDWHLWRLSWLLDQGVYAAKDLATTRQNLLERGDDETSPSGVVYRERLFGKGHPYAMPPATVAQIAAVTRGELDGWRRTRYVPDGATLIITGGFDRAAMRREVDELFGAWPKRTAAARAPVPPPHPAPGPSWMGVRIPTAPQVTLYVGFTATSTGRDDRAARLVLTEMINDRLRLVREGMGASYGVHVAYDGGAGGSGLFVTTALVPARAPEAAAAVLGELAALQHDAAGEASAFARARRRVVAHLLATSRDTASVADELELAARAGLTLDQLRALPSTVATLTPAAVARVATLDLDPAHMVVSVDGPAAPVTATLPALHAPSPTWFDE